ncbi:MAG: HAD hydrolase family protein, partial [Desulfurococcales archaeon]|nr:HAD hydrolase family protein [Desulfurococcales archaeon]
HKGEVARRIKEVINPEVTVAVGDGWNDVPMFKEADLAVGFNPKEAVKPYVDVEVRSFRGLMKVLRLIG